MARVQLALNVDNIEDSVEFYSKMFGVGPAKVREGYANFVVENPPLKLVLIEGHGQGGTLNHVGVEVDDVDGVTEKIQSSIRDGLAIEVQENETCCFAVQDKVWVKGPNIAWEWYTVLDDAPNDVSLKKIPLISTLEGGSCCGPEGC